MITALCFAHCLAIVCGVAMGAAPYNLAGPIVAIIKPKHVAKLLPKHFSKWFVLDRIASEWGCVKLQTFKLRDPLEVINPQNKAICFIEYKNAVPAAHKAHSFSFAWTGQPMFLGIQSSYVVKKKNPR